MKEQGSLFDAVDGAIRREHSIQQVDKAASEAAKAELLQLGYRIAEQRAYFTTDAIRYLYELEGETYMREPRLLGAIMRILHQQGVCAPENEWKQSVWAKNHRRPLRVWKSLIYENGAKPRTKPRPPAPKARKQAK